MDWVLAVDVGGSKFAAGRVDATGRLERRRQVPTPPGAGADELWDALRSLLEDVSDRESPSAVGVGCGGPMRWPEGVVSPLNIPGWREFPLRDRLTAAYPGRPVVVHNDAIAMAVGEYRYGAGRGARAFLGMVVSTGVGGGIVLDGRVVDGPSGNAGHIGHVVVEPAGPVCGCGGHGCLEAIARGPALVAWATELGWQHEGPGPADGRALVASARAGDAIARAALARGGSAIGRAVASVAAVLDLDCIAVGGGIANAGDLLFAPATEAFHRHARLDFLARCRFGPAELGGDAGLLGAAVLASMSA